MQRKSSIHKSIRRAALILLFLAVAIPFLTDTGYTADDDFFLQQHIDVSGVILGCRLADFNGDKKTDIALMEGELSGGRVIKIYLQRESERFPPTASQIIELWPSTNMFQTIDLDGDGRAELLTMDRDGLFLYSHDGEKFSDDPKRAIDQETIFSGGIEGGVPISWFVLRLGDRPVAFIPVDDGIQLWEYTGRKFERLARLDFFHVVRRSPRPVKLFGNLGAVFSVILPDMTIIDGNSDGREDVYLVWPDRMAVHYQNDNGSFNRTSDISFRFQNKIGDNLCQARVVDYDLDGYADLVCCRSFGGISGARTDISFFGSDRIRQQGQASHNISLEDIHGNLMIDNIDRKGGLELVVPAIELGTMSAVKKMLTKKTDFHLLIYPIDNLGRTTPEPAVRHKITCHLDYEYSDPTSGIRIDWSGDYNGDGLPDVVFADGGGQLMFFSGSTEDYLVSKASLVIDMPDPDQIRPVHLNNDRRSDLIIIHKPGINGTRLTLLVTNALG